MNGLPQQRAWQFVKVPILYLLVVVELFAVVLTGIPLGGIPVAHAEPSYTVNYQGKLTTNTGVAVADGTYNMRFFLYQNLTGGSSIWSETLTGASKVQVTNGLFSVMLGSTSALTGVNFNQSLYLGVEIGGSGAPSWDGEMTPRKILGTVPSAFEAQKVGGVASSSFLRSDVADSASGLLTFTGGVISSASSTVSRLSFLNATGTSFYIGGDRITDFTGTGLSMSGTSLTAALGTDIVAAEIANGDHGAFTYAGGSATLDDDVISPDDILSTGQTDEYCLTYESGDTFSWQACGAEDLTNNSIEELQDVAAMTKNYGDLLYWNGSSWADIATSSLGLSVNESTIEGYIFDADNVGTLSSGTLALDSLSYSGTVDDAYINDAITISGGTLGSNSLSSGAVLTTLGTVTIGDGGDRIDISSNTWDVSNGVFTDVTSINGLVITANTGVVTTGTWRGTAVESTYGGTGINTSGSTGIPTISAGTWSVASTLGASYITADTLDFTELQDQLDLDASTDILVNSAEVFSVTNTGTGDSFVVNDASTDTSPFVISAAGNVGVGTTTPGTKFMVTTGTGSLPGDLNTNYNLAAFTRLDNVAGIAILAGNTYSSRIDFGDTDSATAGNIIYNHASNRLSFATNGVSDRLVIESNGDLGIGTSTPQAKFHTYTSAAVAGIFERSTASSNISSEYRNASASWFIGQGSDGNFSIDGDSNLGLAPRFSINTSGQVTAGTWTATAVTDTYVADAITVNAGTLGSNTISSGATWTTAGTLTIGDGGDRIDVSSNTWDVTNGVIANATWNGAAIDISSYTNLGVTATGLTLSGDNVALTAGYTIPLTASTTAWQSALASTHSAVTLAGEDYLSLSTQQITANAIDPDNLSASDFGSFTCNGTTCTVDTGAISNTMLANSSVSYGGVSLSLGGTDATPAFALADATGLPISTGVAGLGTGVATALGVNIGTSGSFITNGGALGTPTSGTLTNATGLPIVAGTTGTLTAARGGTGVTTFGGTNLILYTTAADTLASEAAFTYNPSTNAFAADNVYANIAFFPDINDGATLGSSTRAFADLFLASGGVVNFNDGDVTMTHSANALTFGGATSGYSFDDSITLSGTDNFILNGNYLSGDGGDEGITVSSAGLVTVTNNLAVNSSGASIYFDSEVAADGLGFKRITSNDGAGNWNLRAGGYNSSGLKYAAAGDGYAGLEFNTEGGDTIVLEVATTSASANSAITIAASLTLDASLARATLDTADFSLDNDGDGVAGSTGGDLLFGEGQDAAIWYDGTNLNVNPQVVGTGYTSFTGDVRVATAGTNAASVVTTAGTQTLTNKTWSGAIDIATANFTTGGQYIIDVDGTAYNAAGALTLGAGTDAGIFFDGTDLQIQTQTVAGIILDTEDDTLEVRYSGAAGADFALDGLNLVTGDSYQINNTSVLSATALGSSVVSSSLTSVGTIVTGTWNGTDIDISDYTTLGVTATGLTLSGDNVALTAGYNIPLTASTTAWNSFLNTPSGTITAGNGLTWSTNTLNFDGGDTPAGELGGTWASPTIDDSLAVTSWTLTTPSIATSLTVTDDDWVGLGAAAGRILFDDLATDYVSVLNANVGIGTSTPGSLFTVGATFGSHFGVSSTGVVNAGTWQGTAIDITRGGFGAAFTDPNADQLMFWDDSAAKVTGISTLSGASISGTTLTIDAGSSNITDDSITFADINMTAAIGSDPAFAASDTFFGSAGIIFEGATANTLEGLLTAADISGTDKTWTLPNTTGTLITTGDTGTVTNTMLAGSIAASKLVGTDIATVGTITSGTWGASFSNNVVTPNAVFTTGQTDEYCLTYEATGTTWEWQVCGAGYLTSANIDTSAELDTIVGDDTGSGALVFGTSPEFTTYIDIGSAGVRISDDSDGAITFLGRGNGLDEDLTLNLDDTSNTGVFTSSTGLNKLTFTDIAINTTSNSGYQMYGTTYFYASTTNDVISIGQFAGQTFAAGNTYNNAIGYAAGRYASTTQADFNNYFGYQAGYNNTGLVNNLLGRAAGYNNTGSSSNFIGYAAGHSNSGDYNNFMGYFAGYSNSGDNNNFMGYGAGYNNTGDQNDFMGYNTGRYIQSAKSVAIGSGALYGSHLTTFASDNNVAIGYRAGYAADDGSGNNILIGYQAANNLTTGNNNIIIGYDIDSPTATADNYLNIGNLLFGTDVDGTGSTLSTGKIGIGTTTPDAKLTVYGSGTTLLSVNAAGAANSMFRLYDEGVETAAIYTLNGLNDLRLRGQGGVYLDGGGATNGDLVVTAAGDVGIGTTTPAALLDLYSSAATILSLNRSSTNNAVIEIKNTSYSLYTGLTQAGLFAISDVVNLTTVPAFTVDPTNATTVAIGTSGIITGGTWQGVAVADTYVADAITVTGGTIGSNTIASGAVWTTAGTLTVGDGVDRVDFSTDTWDVTNGAFTNVTSIASGFFDSLVDSEAQVRADTSIYLDLDNDNDGSANVYVRDGANSVVFQITEAGALSVGSISSGFGAIDIGADSLTAGALLASSNDSGALGASGTAWSDLFLASGGVINWNAGDVTLTHSLNTLAIAGGTLTAEAATFSSTLTANGTVTLGDNGDTVAINSNDWDISTAGTITGAEWQGTAVAALYGGTGINTSGSTGIPTISAGTWSVASTLGASYITADTLDFTELQDQLDLDASTDILADGSEVFSVTNSGTGYSFRVNDAAGDTTPFVIDASGLVGIGTSTPGSMLDIYRNNTAIGAMLELGQAGTGDAGLSFGLSGGQTIIMGIDNSDGDSFKISDSTAIGTNDRFVIDSAGAVTISGTLGVTSGLTIDATTETNIEAAIDTLGSLTSASTLATVGTITSGTWQGTAIDITRGGFGAAFTDPNADQLMFWDDSAAKVTGIGTLSGASISGTTLTIDAASSNITDDTITFADINMTAAIGANPAFAASDTFFGSTGIIFEGAAADTIEGLLTSADVSGTDKTWTLPNTTGTLITTGDTGTVTNTMLAGSIAASKLVGTDIATVGTITAGTWTGSVIASAYLDTATILSTEIDTCSELAGLTSTVGSCGSFVLSASPTFTGTANFSIASVGTAVTPAITAATGDLLAGGTAGTFQFDESTGSMYFQRSGATAALPALLRAQRSRGTSAAKSVTVTGDDVFQMSGYGYDGGSFIESSRILFDTEGTIASSSIPGLIRMYTANTSGTVTERLNIGSDGTVTTVNPGTGTGLLVDQNGAAIGLSVDKDLTNAADATQGTVMAYTSTVTDGGTYAKSGTLLSLSNTVTETSGTITDTSITLNVANTHVDSTGTLLNLNSDGTAAIALNIAADNTTADAVNITTLATTAYGLELIANQLTTGSIARFTSNSADTSTRSLVNIINDNAAASGAVALRIQQDSTADIVNFFDGATEIFTILDGGDTGVGVSDPDARLEVFETIGASQLKVSYDATNYAQFQVESDGDLVLDSFGNDIFATDENVWICDGACPTGTPTADGNLVVERGIGVGTSTPITGISVGVDSAIHTYEKNISDASPITVDWNQGNQQLIRLAASRTVNFSNVKPGQTLQLVVCRTAGSYTATWGSTIRWANGTTPTQTTTSNKCDAFSFFGTLGDTGSAVVIFGSYNLNF